MANACPWIIETRMPNKGEGEGGLLRWTGSNLRLIVLGYFGGKEVRQPRSSEP